VRPFGCGTETGGGTLCGASPARGVVNTFGFVFLECSAHSGIPLPARHHVRLRDPSPLLSAGSRDGMPEGTGAVWVPADRILALEVMES